MKVQTLLLIFTTTTLTTSSSELILHSKKVQANVVTLQKRDVYYQIDQEDCLDMLGRYLTISAYKTEMIEQLYKNHHISKPDNVTGVCQFSVNIDIEHHTLTFKNKTCANTGFCAVNDKYLLWNHLCAYNKLNSNKEVIEIWSIRNDTHESPFFMLSSDDFPSKIERVVRVGKRDVLFTNSERIWVTQEDENLKPGGDDANGCIIQLIRSLEEVEKYSWCCSGNLTSLSFALSARASYDEPQTTRDDEKSTFVLAILLASVAVNFGGVFALLIYLCRRKSGAVSNTPAHSAAKEKAASYPSLFYIEENDIYSYK